MPKMKPHALVPPAEGTRDAQFGWCAREDCGSVEDSYVHAAEEERRKFNLSQAIAHTPPKRLARARWMFEFLVDREAWMGCRDWDGLSDKVKGALIDMAAYQGRKGLG